MNSFFLIDAVSAAIRISSTRGTLRVSKEYNARMGVDYWSISDEIGIISVAMTEQEAIEMIGGLK